MQLFIMHDCDMLYNILLIKHFLLFLVKIVWILPPNINNANKVD